MHIIIIIIMLKKVTIYGERCSGTHYLTELLTTNFNVHISWEHLKHGRHFMGFDDLSNTDDTLFIGIIRSPYDWFNSLYRRHHHIPRCNLVNVDSFLYNEFFSMTEHSNGDVNTEIMFDRNMHTKERYKNIFEMRDTKNKFLVDDMPLLVKNYLLITHDSLLDNFENTMNSIKNMGLDIKSNIEFPLNIAYYKNYKTQVFVRNSKPMPISKELIVGNLNMTYEKRLFADYI